MSSFKSNLAGVAMIFGIAAAGLGFVGFASAKMGVNPLMTDYDGATEAVEKAGYSNVKATGYGWFDCGIGEQSDLWRTRFTATAPNGETVDGTVCAGVLKAATLRF